MTSHTTCVPQGLHIVTLGTYTLGRTLPKHQGLLHVYFLDESTFDVYRLTQVYTKHHVFRKDLARKIEEGIVYPPSYFRRQRYLFDCSVDSYGSRELVPFAEENQSSIVAWGKAVPSSELFFMVNGEMKPREGERILTSTRVKYHSFSFYGKAPFESIITASSAVPLRLDKERLLPP